MFSQRKLVRDRIVYLCPLIFLALFVVNLSNYCYELEISNNQELACYVKNFQPDYPEIQNPYFDKLNWTFNPTSVAVSGVSLSNYSSGKFYKL